MPNSLELIRVKIAELEAKLADLRIAERELSLASSQTPYAREGEQRAAFIKRKPVRHLGPAICPFTKGRGRH